MTTATLINQTAMTNETENVSDGNDPPMSEEQAQRHLETVIDSASAQPVDAKTILESLSTSEPGSISDSFGRYKILEELGRGAMGSVYLAEDQQLAREVALKIPHFRQPLDPVMVQRFYREAQAAATLRHPGICPVFDVGEIDGQHYITMAYIQGQSLRDFITSDAQEVKHAVRIIRKLALALAEAHKHNVVHRDLKPANIMIDERKEPVVMDFGLAYRSTEGEERLTHSGTIMGTPAYMPPEQVDGDIESIGAAADIYSLGVIFYEMLTGTLPFSGKLMSILKQIANDDPKPPSSHRKGIEPALEKICLKMMAKQIEDRYASMDDVASDLGKYLKKRLLGTDASITIKPESRNKKSKTKSRSSSDATERFAAPLATADDEFDSTSESDEYTPLKRSTPSRKSKQSTKTPLLIACGVAAVLFLAVVFLLTQNNAETPEAPTDDLVASIQPNDNSNDVADSASDEDNTQPATTAPTTEFDAENYALNFDGDSYVTIRGINRDENGPITIEAYIRVHQKNDGPIMSGLGVSLHLARGKLRFYAESRDGNSGTASLRLGPKDRLPRLQHVAGVWDGETARLFVDGLEGVEDFKSNVDLGEWWSSSDFVIGKRSDQEHFYGTIDEFRISSSARYKDSFVPPRFNERWTSDTSTIALLHFDEGDGRSSVDASGNADKILITNPSWMNLRSQRPLPLIRRFRNGRP